MEILPFQKRTWVEVDIEAIRNNYRTIKGSVSDRKVCCVIKANAYGHGAVPLARIYESEGADYFAVSNVEEALQLRDAGIASPILVLGYTDPRCAGLLAENDVTQCVFSKEFGEKLAECAVREKVSLKVHLKIDTGMGRLGFRCLGADLSDLVDAMEIMKSANLEPEGIFTHFARADEGIGGIEYTDYQYNNFCRALDFFNQKGVDFELIHCANSAAICDYPKTRFNMVRAGIILYGLNPSTEIENPLNLTQTLTMKTVIDNIKTVVAGDRISYGGEFVANHDMKIATVPIGYADGFYRSNFRNGTLVEVEGEFVPIVGRICMDQCMLDVTDVGKAHVGSEVTVYGTSENNSPDRIAANNGTINYEVLCSIGERVPRIYCEDGNCVLFEDGTVCS